MNGSIQASSRTWLGDEGTRGFVAKDRIFLTERQLVECRIMKWGVTRDQMVTAHHKGEQMANDIGAELGKKRYTSLYPPSSSGLTRGHSGAR